MSFLFELDPVLQTLLATLMTWFVTALGASVVIFFKEVDKKILDSMMGFAGGVMIAASFWSLLSPAIEICDENLSNTWMLPAIGFFAGGVFIVIADIMFDKFTQKGDKSLRRSVLVSVAVTLHNFPEGMVIGVAFANAALTKDTAAVAAAMVLAIGIAIQNFPEGISVSMPLRRDGLSVGKSFLFGQMSGLVEPIGGLIGVLLALKLTYLLPFMLCFSAGTMIAVSAVELIPEASKTHKNLACIAVIIGFIVMMVLDISLG